MTYETELILSYIFFNSKKNFVFEGNAKTKKNLHLKTTDFTGLETRILLRQWFQ